MKTTFGKSLKDILNVKKGFQEENDRLLKETHEVNKKYNQQPTRKVCKNCEFPIVFKKHDFLNHGIKYKICRNCGHLNGEKEDSVEFANWFYKDDDGAKYLPHYIKDYEERVSKIYLPKAKYLVDTLSQICNINKFSQYDMGCGGGHFVAALSSLGVKAYGYDINKRLINLAKNVWEQNDKPSLDNPPFNTVASEEELIKKIKSSNVDVISFIGVLEHLRNPNQALNAFYESKAKYMFFCVPLFSLTTYIENICNSTFPRNLGADHTHLYTFESINYFCEKYSFEQIAQWHFGTDAMDLRRSLIIEASKNNTSEYALKVFQEKILSPKIMDELQLVLDKNFVGSEIHMLVKKI